VDNTTKQFVDLYTLSDRTLRMALKDITEDEAFTRPSGQANSLHFILGHITSPRYYIAGLLGNDEEPPWGTMFDMGAEIQERDACPPFSELVEKWDAITPNMVELLSAATEEKLSEPGPFQPPSCEKTVRGVISFLSWHEAYHVGQAGYVRKLLGHPGAVG
jgi:uncharacterized damage-inducible protein DinB